MSGALADRAGANVCGAFLFAAAIVHTHAFDAAVTAAFAADARHLVEGSFGSQWCALCSAGWLLALMVWLLPRRSRRGSW